MKSNHATLLGIILFFAGFALAVATLLPATHATTRIKVTQDTPEIPAVKENKYTYEPYFDRRNHFALSDFVIEIKPR